jgi:hypothetical protein
MIIRLLVYVLIIYLLFRFLKRILGITNQKRSVNEKRNEPVNPPPYDKNKVEDIDYDEIN